MQEAPEEAQEAGDDGGHGVGEGVDEGAQAEDGAVPSDHQPGLGTVTRAPEAGDHARPGVASDELTVNHPTENLKKLFILKLFEYHFSEYIQYSIIIALTNPEYIQSSVQFHYS